MIFSMKQKQVLRKFNSIIKAINKDNLKNDCKIETLSVRLKALNILDKTSTQKELQNLFGALFSLRPHWINRISSKNLPIINQIEYLLRLNTPIFNKGVLDVS